MKFYRFLAAFLAAVSLLVFSACGSAATKVELTDEEAHKLCETYSADVEWVRYTRENAPDDLKTYARLLSEDPDNIVLCEVRVVSVEEVTEKTDSFFCELTVKVEKIFEGNPSLFQGKQFTVSAVQLSSGSFDHLVGQRYVTFATRNDYHDSYFLCRNPMCLIVEDDTLVSPMGCTFEEAEDGYGFECRNYTGQKLGYYVKLVKDAIEQHKAE